MKKSLFLVQFILLLTLFYPSSVSAQNISILFDDPTAELDFEVGRLNSVVVANNGDLYVSSDNDNVIRITPDGIITEIIDTSGDGNGNLLLDADDVLVDDDGNVYVAGRGSHNVYKIAPDGTLTRMISATGDNEGHSMAGPIIALGNDGTLYVAGAGTNNAFKVTPDGEITRIINVFGDNRGNMLLGPSGIAVDSQNNVYISSAQNDLVFRIRENGNISVILDYFGDGVEHILDSPYLLKVDNADNLYVVGYASNNVFKRALNGNLSVLIDVGGDLTGNFFTTPAGIDVDSDGNVYVVGTSTQNAFRINPEGDIIEILDERGDKMGKPMEFPRGIAAGHDNTAYVLSGFPIRIYQIDDTHLPVEWVNFEVLANSQEVTLQWSTASETNNAGFEVQQKSDSGDWQTLVFIPGTGTTINPQSYNYIVNDLTPREYVFRLKQIDFDGSFEYSKQVAVNITTEGSYQMWPAFPNPFTSQTHFKLSVDKTQFVRIEVYNPLGQRVALLHDGLLGAHETHVFEIDGLGFSSGVYLYKVTGTHFTNSRLVTFSR